MSGPRPPRVNCPSCQSENAAAAADCASCGAPLSDAVADLLVKVDLRPGAVFHSRYEILAPLGQGGMGLVFKAKDQSLDEIVAIKVLRPEFAAERKMAERFKSEIKLARRVRHRNVCAIHDYGEAQGLLYISMEFIDGVDLKQALKRSGGLPRDRAYGIAVQVSEGLQAVHEAGIVHRDLKTPNIMLDADGVARLMDFGIAKRHGAETTFTGTGNLVGTPEYMSPEQAQGHKIDFRSDIYALGIVVYEIFTGRVPFRGETPISTILKHINEPPPLGAAGIPSELRPVLARALSKEPSDRQGSARELARDLERCRAAAGHPATEEMAAATLVGRPPAGRPARALQPWLLAVPLIAAAGGVIAVSQRHRAAPAAEPSPATAAVETSPAPADAVPTAGDLAAAPPAAARPLPTAAPSTPPTTMSPIGEKPGGGVVQPRPRGVPSRAPVVSPAAHATVAPTAAAPAAPATPEPGEGLLQVAVIPWGEVIVDGRLVGTTPLDRIRLAAGAHTVRIRHPAYEVEERRVTIRDGQVERLLVDFPGRGGRRP